MLHKIFAVVGYSRWGKSNTLYTLFDRHNFFPLKSPIRTRKFPLKKFTVVNASNEDRTTDQYLHRLKKVLETHVNSGSVFVITISLDFTGGSHDVKAVFNYLNSLSGFEIEYLVLKNGWKNDSSLLEDDLNSMTNEIKAGRITLFDEQINQSTSNFEVRTNEIAHLINY